MAKDLVAETLLELFCKAYDSEWNRIENNLDERLTDRFVKNFAYEKGYVIIEDPDVAELWYIFKDGFVVCHKKTHDGCCSYELAGMENKDLV